MIWIKAQKCVLEGGMIAENIFVGIENGIIKFISKPNEQFQTKTTEQNDQIFETEYLLPGFFDIHNHGYGDTPDMADYWSSDYTLSKLPSFGTTSVLASISFPSDRKEKTKELVQHLRKTMQRKEKGFAILEGLHGEGPIVHTLGGLPTNQETQMEISEFEKFLDENEGLKVMTISPLIDSKSNYGRIRALLKRNILPALGHDANCTEQQILGALKIAFEAKRNFHITHLFNACAFHHRSPGLVNFGLLSSPYPALKEYEGILEPSIELIGDLVHLHPMTIQLALRSKDKSMITFITDAVADSVPNKVINAPGKLVQVNAEGTACYVKDSQTLFGSTTNLANVFRSLVRTFGLDVGQAARMLSENPAKIMRMNHIGIIQVGRNANLTCWSKDLNLEKTFVFGQLSFEEKRGQKRAFGSDQ